MAISESEWRETVPGLVKRYLDAWDLQLGEPYPGGSISYVAPVRTADGADAVLKLSYPHREAVGEATALQWWDGHGAIRLLRHDAEDWALLVERCDPGLQLTEAELPAEERLTIAAELLAGLWERGIPLHTQLESVGDVCREWADLVEERMRLLAPPYDPGLVARGVDLLRTLPQSTHRTVVVHGDFNPGNILSATRTPWLVIDAKPMIGDPGYDPCPLLMQVDPPFDHADPGALLRDRTDLVSAILGEPPERLLAWCFARMIESALWYASRGELAEGQREVERAAVVAELLDRIGR
jgi:streptomycin 6-kinase